MVFNTDIDSEDFPPGLTLDTVKLISSYKKELKYMTDFRLKAYKQWQKMSEPIWSNSNMIK